MKKVNTFPALMAPCPLIFLSNLSNTDKVALAANLRKTSSTWETASSVRSYYLMFYQEIYLAELF